MICTTFRMPFVYPQRLYSCNDTDNTPWFVPPNWIREATSQLLAMSYNMIFSWILALGVDGSSVRSPFLVHSNCTDPLSPNSEDESD